LIIAKEIEVSHKLENARDLVIFGNIVEDANENDVETNKLENNNNNNIF
jgi:hypothetical protein